ncbi:MAG: S-layer homology domain-containing protein, partial [Clostridiaceae bacterium]|nr:S-layer homology domain-containing protein [Clostridiaceae bacterium]
QKAAAKLYAAPVTREEAALWTARALGLQPVTGDQTTEVFSYSDWGNIKTENLPYIEAVLKSGIRTGSSGSAFSPKGSISRSEMASILNSVANRALDKLGFTVGNGKVASVTVKRDLGPLSDNTVTNIVIQDTGSDNVNINISQQSLPVIKNGKVGDESLITQGDVVEYTVNKDNQAVLLHVARLREAEGTYINYDPENQTIQFTDKENNRYLLKVLPDSIIQAEGEPVEIGRVEPNTAAKAVFANDVLKSLEVNVPVETLNNDEMAVKIIYADALGNVLKVADEYDNKQYLDFDENTAVYINGERQGIDAIGFDQDAALKVAGGRVLEIRIFTDMEEEDEYRAETLTGKIRTASGDTVVISPDTTPEKEVPYKIDSRTVIFKNGTSTDSTVLRRGDNIKFRVDPGNNKYVSRIDVQGQGALIDKIYKGDIVDVLPATGEIILTRVYNYGYYDWQSEGNYQKYRISQEAAIYIGNEKSGIDGLKDQIGKPVYAVSKDNYGTEELIQISLKEGYEDTVYKTISSVKWTEKQLTLSNGKLLNYADGTIVVKDGRLLDTRDLDSGAGAFIIQNRSASGVDNASVVCLDSFNAFTNYRITKGYINDIGEDYFSIDNPFILKNNTWAETPEEELLFRLSDETVIYDAVQSSFKYISPDEFAESRYEPYTYLWPNYKKAGKDEEYHDSDSKYHYDYSRYRNDTKYHEHYMVYVVYDEYNIAKAVMLYKKDKQNFNPDRRIDTERMIAGTIGSIREYDSDLITIKDVREYNSTYEEWRYVKASMSIDTDRAIIVTRQGATAGLDNLEINSEAYILCEDNEAILLLVE